MQDWGIDFFIAIDPAMLSRAETDRSGTVLFLVRVFNECFFGTKLGTKYLLGWYPDV